MTASRRAVATTAAVWIVAAAAAFAAPDDKTERHLGGIVVMLAVSPDGKCIAAEDVDQSISLFTSEHPARQLVVSYNNLVNPPIVTHLLFTGDSRSLVFRTSSLAGNVSLHVVDVASGKEARTIKLSGEGPDGAYGSMLCAVPATSTLCVSRLNAVETWDAVTGTLVNSRPVEHGPAATATAPGVPVTAELVSHFAGAERWTVIVRESAASKERCAFDVSADIAAVQHGKSAAKKNHEYVELCGFSGDGRYLVVGEQWEESAEPAGKKGVSLPRYCCRIVTIESTTGKPAWNHDLPDHSSTSAITAFGDAVAALAGEKLEILDAATGARREIVADQKYSCIAASPSGSDLWGGTRNGHILKVRSSTAAPPK